MNAISISVSKVLAYQNCPRHFFLRYVMKLPEADSSNLVFGGAFHSAAEVMVQKMDAEPDLPVEEVAALGKAVWMERFVLDEPELREIGAVLCDKFPGRWKDHGFRLAKVRNSAGALMNAVEVDGAWEVDSGIRVVGRADLIVVDHENDLVALDIKTPLNGSNANFLPLSLQLTSYAQMFSAKKGGFLECRKLAIPKTSRGKGPTIEDAKIAIINDDLREDHRQAVCDVVGDILDGRFPRTPRMAHNTPCGMCEYSSMCGGVCVSRNEAKAMARDVFFRGGGSKPAAAA